jgi:hypothetical protein
MWIFPRWRETEHPHSSDAEVKNPAAIAQPHIGLHNLILKNAEITLPLSNMYKSKGRFTLLFNKTTRHKKSEQVSTVLMF